MADVLVKPAFQSAATDSGDATKLGPSAWNAARLFSGGVDGEILTRSAASSTGAAWSAAGVAAGSVLVSAGVGLAPVWSATPALDRVTVGMTLTPGSPPKSIEALGFVQAAELRARRRVPAGGLVSFVFDDGNDTDFTLMQPLFAAQGEVACSAIVTDWIGNVGRLTWAQVAGLAAAGWEIASHTVTHNGLATMTEAQLRVEFGDSRAAIESRGLTVNCVVYPGGDHNALVRQIAREYYRAGRQVMNDGRINKETFLTYALRAVVIDDPSGLATYKTDVDAAVAGKCWVIFYLHGTDAADATAMNELIDYIQAAGASIVTMTQALDRMGNTLEWSDGGAISDRALLSPIVAAAGSLRVTEVLNPDKFFLQFVPFTVGAGDVDYLAKTYAGGIEKTIFTVDSSAGKLDALSVVGALTAGTNVIAGAGSQFVATASTKLYADANGSWVMWNSAQNDFTRLKLGGTSSAFAGIGRDGAGVKITAADGTTGSWLSGVEMAADATAPEANGWRLYARDNGAGKTQLVARFASGAVQVMATEP